MYRLAIDYDTLWYIHVADPSNPSEDSLNRPGERTIPLLDILGVLRSSARACPRPFPQRRRSPARGRSWGAHLMQPGERDVVWRRNSGHSPPLAKRREGRACNRRPASNNGLSLFREAWLASLGQKVRRGMGPLSPEPRLRTWPQKTAEEYWICRLGGSLKAGRPILWSWTRWISPFSRHVHLHQTWCTRCRIGQFAASILQATKL